MVNKKNTSNRDQNRSDATPVTHRIQCKQHLRGGSSQLAMRRNHAVNGTENS
jgi:hypothetical protein